MPRFRFTQTYKSNLAAGNKGDEVDLAEDLAALVNNDAPGTLTAVKMVKVEDEQDEEETRAVDKPPSDRMVHGAPKKRTEREPEEPIDKSTFKAVKKP